MLKLTKNEFSILFLAIGAGLVFAHFERTRLTANFAKSLSTQTPFHISATSDGRLKNDIAAATLLPGRDSQLRKSSVASLKARELQILGSDGQAIVQFAVGADNSTGLFMTRRKDSATVQMGVHENNLPFVMVADGGVRNFGLGRVDGKNASPIIVFRKNDEVRAVFGLNMTEKGKPPFLVHYSADGERHEFLGSYCDNDDRACTE